MIGLDRAVLPRQIERRCRITGADNPIHLVASHCKPWCDSSNEERLNGEDGLLLTPSIDHLFDCGFIGFEDSGRLVISPVAHLHSLNAWVTGPLGPIVSRQNGSAKGRDRSGLEC